MDWEKLPIVQLRQLLAALLATASGKEKPAASRMDIVRRVFQASPGDSFGSPDNTGQLWPNPVGDAPVNPWVYLKDKGSAWAICEFLRRLYRRGAISDVHFPQWAQEAEVVEVRDRKRVPGRWVLQHPVSGAKVEKPQGGLAQGLQGILGMLGGPCEPGPAPKPAYRCSHATNAPATPRRGGRSFWTGG